MIVRVGLLFAALLTSFPSAMAWAEDYPNRRLTVVVPFPAGSGPDVYARIIAEKLSARLAQPVIIENRPGAGGATGGRAVAKAEADGYTILFGSTSSVVVSPAIAKEAPFDPVTAF